MQTNASDHPTMTIHEASPELKTCGQAIIAEQMEKALRTHSIDPRNEETKGYLNSILVLDQKNIELPRLD